MSIKKWLTILIDFDKNPVLSKMLIQDREKLIDELLEPSGRQNESLPGEMEVGYEASWLVKQSQ